MCWRIRFQKETWCWCVLISQLTFCLTSVCPDYFRHNTDYNVCLIRDCNMIIHDTDSTMCRNREERASATFSPVKETSGKVTHWHPPLSPKPRPLFQVGSAELWIRRITPGAYLHALACFQPRHYWFFVSEMTAVISLSPGKNCIRSCQGRGQG